MSGPTCSICHHLSHDGVRCTYVQPADKGLISPRCDCRGPKQIPPKCPSCPHLAHVGRCGNRNGILTTCQCPGPSDSAPRPAKSRPYEVGLHERLRDRAYACSYLKECADDPDETCFLVALFEIVRAHEVKPDEPPCPCTPQELREIAELGVNFVHHQKMLLELASWLASMERKGA